MQGKLSTKKQTTETCAVIVGRFQTENGYMGDIDMARTLGVTRQTVWNWRTGNAEPSIEQIQKIAHEHEPGTWPFEMAAALADAQYAAVRQSIRARAG